MEVKKVSYKNIFKNVNYSFHDEKITSIIGPSGCGKTLFTYLLSGIIKPDEGEIVNNKKVGYLFQEPFRQFLYDTVYEDMSFTLKQNNYKTHMLDKQIRDSLKLVELDDSYLTKKIAELSEGEKTKVALSLVLSLNPKVIILDEPTIYLDSKSVSQLERLLIKLKKDYHKTIIIASNNIDFVYKVTDNVLLLNKGKIILQESKDKILDNMLKIKKGGMEIPKILEFIALVEKTKGIKLEPTNDIQELMKDIYRHGK